MSQFVKGDDGKVYLVSEENVVTRESVVGTVDKAKELLKSADDALARFDAVNAVSQPKEEKAPEVAPTTVADPANVPVESQPQQLNQTQPAPVETVVAPEPETPPTNLEIQ